MKEKYEMEFDREQINTIKKDNKKAGGQYIILLAVCGFLGLFIGFAAIWIFTGLSQKAAVFEAFMNKNAVIAAAVISCFMAAFLLAVTVWVMHCVRKGRKDVARLMEEDDTEGLYAIEKKLSYAMWITNGIFILEYLYFALIIFGSKKYLSGGIRFQIIMAGIAVLFAGLMIVPLLQQKTVDLIRLINPEKKGSIYDPQFHKKWEESCDEAEQLVIYKASYKAFRAANLLCIGLWVFFLMLGIVTGVGFLPVLAVIIIWTALLCVYNYYSIRLSDYAQKR